MAVAMLALVCAAITANVAKPTMHPRGVNVHLVTLGRIAKRLSLQIVQIFVPGKDATALPMGRVSVRLAMAAVIARKW